MARFMDFHEGQKLPAKTASPASKTSKPKALAPCDGSRNARGWSGPSPRPHLRYIYA